MSKDDIRISKNLALPVDTVTQAVAILAKRRMGKSYLARKMAEGMHAAGQQIIIIDPKGDWWGIRSSADGKSDGLPILIIGGEHGDIPLDAGAGETIAKLAVEERVSVLLDLSELRKHEVASFMPAFMETLYRLKAREQYRTPVIVFTDEADAIAPQKPQPNEARMLGAFNDLVRRGGQRGIGVVFITQRSAVLSKDVLTQAQILIALRVIAPQDLAAIKAWVDVHGTLEEQKTLMASLPALPVGDAWVWSPGWPTEEGIFKRIHTLPIATFDSGATPKPGERATAPKRLADIDLEAVKRQMAETLERAKADDPKALRARISELEEQLESAQQTVPAVEVQVPTFDEEAFRRLFEVIDERTGESIQAISQAKADIGQQLVTYRDAIRELIGARPPQRTTIAQTKPDVVHRDTKPAKPQGKPIDDFASTRRTTSPRVTGLFRARVSALAGQSLNALSCFERRRLATRPSPRATPTARTATLRSIARKVSKLVRTAALRILRPQAPRRSRLRLRSRPLTSASNEKRRAPLIRTPSARAVVMTAVRLAVLGSMSRVTRVAQPRAPRRIWTP